MAGSLHNAWSEWDASAWNTALFRYFFEVTEQAAGPVTRLMVTPEELRRATGDTEAEVERIKEAFLDAIRVPPREFRRRLSTRQLDRHGEWRTSEIPPFVVYLLFTCFVASSVEADVVDDGVFRSRLRTLMRHPEGASYALEGLAGLWEAFARWLRCKRQRGAPYRELVLPDPGGMTRIGYSIRLAFPPRKDHLRLIQLLHDEGFDRDPPVEAVLHVVGSRIGGFSQRFREVYDNFRLAFFWGHTPQLGAHPFWSAVRDALVRAPVTVVADSASARFQLFMESDAELSAELILATQTAEIGNGRITVLRAEQPLSEYPYIVAIAGEEGGARRAVGSLLAGDYRHLPRTLERSPVGIAVKQGVLLFRLNEIGLRELSTSRPEEGKIWALVRKELVDPFRRIFPEDDRPTPVPSRYQRWYEFPCFDGSVFRGLGTSTPPGLEYIRCLQPTVSGTRIHLSGGVPVDGGYLGLSDCLPIVRVAGGDKVVLASIEENPDSVDNRERPRLELTRRTDDTFEFPRSKDLVLDGPHILTAWSGEHVIGRRRIDFRGLVAWPTYERPTDPNDWLVEAADVDMVAPTTDPALPEAREEPQTNSQRYPVDRGCPCRRRPGATRLTLASFPEVRVGVRAFIADRDDEWALARFMEISAGLAIRRKGIPEPEFLDRLGDVLGIDDYCTLWDVARAWVEAGFFDLLARRNWRGRSYFARDPRLVVWRTTGGFHATLMGITPRHVRNRIENAARSVDVSTRLTTSHSRWVPPLLSWTAQSCEVFDRIASESGLQLRHWLVPPDTYVAHITGILSNTDPPGEPHGYELRGHWNWERGQFTREPPSSDTPVVVEWYDRPDRQQLFLVKHDGTPYWSSHSRNWALLVAYTLAGIPPFEKVGESILVRGVSGQVYLPLPLSRAIAAMAEAPPGPATLNDRRWTYAYSFRSRAERDELLRLLWGGGISEAILRRVRWLVELIRAHNASNVRLIALPPGVRNALLRHAEFPEFATMATMNVPPSILPHIYAVIAEIENQ